MFKYFLVNVCYIWFWGKMYIQINFKKNKITRIDLWDSSLQFRNAFYCSLFHIVQKNFREQYNLTVAYVSMRFFERLFIYLTHFSTKVSEEKVKRKSRWSKDFEELMSRRAKARFASEADIRNKESEGPWSWWQEGEGKCSQAKDWITS